MKKCPHCLKREEIDATRFCKNCGTELFFEHRFEATPEKGINPLLHAIKRIIRRI